MINDKFEPQKISGRKLPKFKGHVKLTLKDTKTGEVQQVVEGDNIVTNALNDIIEQCDYFGCVDYNKILPLWSKWFAGSLLYAQPFPVNEVEELDANDYFIKNDSVNTVVAHAGDTFTSDIRDDPKRGMPNTYLQNREPKSITMAWQWGPTQGNGEISAVSLCHKDIGNCGTGSNSNAFKTLEPFEIVNASNFGTFNAAPNIIGQLDDTTCFDFERIDQHTIGFNLYKTSFNKVAIKTTNYFDLIDTFSAHYGNFSWFRSFGGAFSWDEKNKNFWLFSNLDGTYSSYTYGYSKTWLQYLKVHFYKSGSSWAIQTNYGVIYPNDQDLGAIPMNTAYRNRNNAGSNEIAHQTKMVEGVEQDVFYFPQEDGYFRRFNFQNQQDTNLVSFIDGPGSGVGGFHWRACSCGVYDDDVLVMPGHVINKNIGYPCKVQFPLDDHDWFESWAIFTDDYAIVHPNKALSFIYPIRMGLNQIITDPVVSTAPRYLAINKFLNITKFNLPNSVMKTASQTMELEYTITEVD